MKRNIELILLFLLATTTTLGQAPQSYSNETVIIGENEFMPFVRGEVSTSHHLINNVPESIPNSNTLNSYKQHFSRIEKVLAEWAPIQPPKGFAVYFSHMTYVGPQTNLSNTKTSISGITEIMFCCYTRNENGEKIPRKGTGAVADIYLNTPSDLCGKPLLEDILIGPRKVADFHGMSVYQTNNQEVTVISKKGIPIFVPVTREAYLHACIRQARILQSNERANRPQTSTPRESMEETYRELIKTNPEVAVEFKRDMEQVLADLEDELEDEPECISQTMLTSLTNELKNMSTAERESQAYYALGGMELYNNFSGLVPAERQTEAETLVRINPQLIDESRPNELQLLTIHWDVGHKNSDKPRFYNQGTEGFQLADENMARLYNEPSVWQKIFQLVVK
jgi:hypothetical protein